MLLSYFTNLRIFILRNSYNVRYLNIMNVLILLYPTQNNKRVYTINIVFEKNLIIKCIIIELQITS